MSRRKILVLAGTGIAGLSARHYNNNFRKAANFDEEASFKIAAIPDTQKYVQNPDYMHHLEEQIEWIAESEDDIQFAIHEGDLVDDVGDEEEWARIIGAMEPLDNSEIPYTITPGNHDLETPEQEYTDERYLKFVEGRFEDQEGYIGSGPNGLSHHQKFEANGTEFLSVGLPWKADQESIERTQEIIDENKGTPTIFNTHALLNKMISGHAREINFMGKNMGYDGKGIFEEIVEPNEQIFMTNSGHYFGSLVPFSYGGEYHQISQNKEHEPIIETLSNYQALDEGGQGFLRIFELTPSEDGDFYKIEAETYSPSLDEYRDTRDSSFSYEIEFEDRFDLD